MDDSINRSVNRIIMFTVIGILLTGTLVGTSTALLQYYDASNRLEQLNAVNAEAEAEALDHLMARYRVVAEQTASRTEIRDRLQAFTEGLLSLETLVSFTLPRLVDAIGRPSDLAGIIRLNAARELLLSVGRIGSLPTQPTHHPVAFVLPDDNSAAANRPMFRASAPITTDQGEQIGLDLLYFTAEEILALLQPEDQLQPHSRLLLLVREANQLLNATTSGLELLPIPSALARALEAAPVDEASILRYGENGNKQVVFYNPLQQFDGALLLQIPSVTLYSPALTHLSWIILIIVLMMTTGALLTGRAVQPLVARIIKQSQLLAQSSSELKMAASVFENTQEAIVISDPELNILRINQAFSDMLGYPPEQVLGQNLEELFEKKYQSNGFIEAVFDRLDREGAWQGEIWYHRLNDGAVPALQTISAVRDSGPTIQRLIHIFNDISETKRSEQRMQRLAQQDALTGLANRAALHQRIDTAVRQAQLRRETLALLFLDLDRFKPVNDQLGHQIGDEILRSAARRMANGIREGDLLGRFGGDEFLVLLRGPDPASHAGGVAQKLIDLLSRPFHVAGRDVEIGASVGIALYPEDGTSTDELIKCADEAMYQVKHEGRNHYRFAHPGQGETK